MIDVVIAAIAGFVSFISPCVLPLVPAYIGYMGGRMTHTVSAQVTVGADGTAQIQRTSFSMRFSTFMHGLAFVGGFTFIFVTLGILGTAFIQQIGSTATVETMIGRVGGVLVIFFGLHFMGVLPSFFNWVRKRPQILNSVVTSLVVAVALVVLISWGFAGTVTLWDTSSYVQWAGMLSLVVIAFVLLGMVLGGAFTDPSAFWNKTLNTLDAALYADTRRQMTTNGSQGLSGSAIMGVVFAAGWTPCIGPTLGLAMTMAANGGDIGQSAILMTAYSLGLGIPFLITALMLDSAQGWMIRLKSHMNTIKLVSGAFLVFIGFAIATGSLQDLSLRFSRQFGDLSVRIEECTIGALEGEIGWGQYRTCVDGDADFYTLREEHTGIGIDGEPVDRNDEATDTNVETILTGDLDQVDVVPGLVEEGDADTSLINLAPVTSLSQAVGPVTGLGIGNHAPDFTTITINGETVSLSDYQGQVVLLNFWFTDCVPCRIEMPEFQSAYEQYQDDGLVILAVNRKESVDEIVDFAEPFDLTFPLLLDETGILQEQFGIFGYPSTYVIDRDGVIQFRTFSALTEKQIETLITDSLS